MAVTSYEKDGKVLWSVYISLRSTVVRKVRVQKRINGIENEKAARTEEKKLLSDLSKQLVKEEARGSLWEEVINRWEADKLTYSLDDYTKTTVQDYAARLRNWTAIWFGKPAATLNRADGRDVLRYATEQGKGFSYVRRLKNMIHLVYGWGIEERIIQGVATTPVFGIDLGKQKEEKLPEILTLDEIKALLRSARQREEKWEPVWTMALLTGMRSGELHALPWGNIEMVTEEDAKRQDELPSEKRYYGLIRVVVNYSARTKSIGPTKGGYWRTVPISGELYWFLARHRAKARLAGRGGPQDFVLPRSWHWDRGMQAQILRKFCLDVSLKSIKFHTLRACFATQLISSGVAPTTVMKICGWKDLKTMQRYIRMAGIEERGATESLRFLPHRANEQFAVGQVVTLFDYQAERSTDLPTSA